MVVVEQKLGGKSQSGGMGTLGSASGGQRREVKHVSRAYSSPPQIRVLGYVATNPDTPTYKQGHIRDPILLCVSTDKFSH